MADDGSDNSSGSVGSNADNSNASGGDPRGSETPGGYSGTSESYSGSGYSNDGTTSADPGNYSSPSYTATPSDIGNSYYSPALADVGYPTGIDIGGQVAPTEAAYPSSTYSTSEPNYAAITTPQTLPSNDLSTINGVSLPTFAQNVPSAQYDVLSPPANQGNVYATLAQLEIFKQAATGDVANQPSNPNAVYDTLPIFAQQNLTNNWNVIGSLPPNTADMVTRLQALGATPIQAAGFVGGLTGETTFSLNPNAMNPHSGAYGIAQDLGARLKDLQSYPGYQGNYNVQADQLINDLQTYAERPAYQALMDAATLDQGVNSNLMFERPWDANPVGSMNYMNPTGPQNKENLATRIANANTILGAITQNVSTAGYTSPSTPTDTASGLYGDAVSYGASIDAMNLGDAGSVAFAGSALSDAAVANGGLDTTTVAPTQVAGIRIPHIPAPEPPTVGQGPTPNVSATGGFAGNIAVPSSLGGGFGFDVSNLPYNVSSIAPAPASTVTGIVTSIPSLIGHGISQGIDAGRSAIPSVTTGGSLGMSIGVPGLYNASRGGANISGSPFVAPLSIPISYNRIVPLSALGPSVATAPVEPAVAQRETLPHSPFSALGNLFAALKRVA